ncbi:type IV secretion system protein VirB10 [Salmonella enterica subsp. enterica serovar Dublin]|uniref:TrwE protein n=2 Tax=Salmonella enterica TaxID=28901 RepID=A0A729WZV2_SALER|nr:type IV secretion system protein VirB10 [Bordetella avium]EDM2856842.1 TrwE protein [Salmonella enterica subsp. enterica serovar Typhimurium]EEF7217826.1 TrwE protein [Salmonella enterica]EGK2871216.1 TrwE protein [Escherichia coli]EGW7971574.1 TrwE protein [Salmonella enterica subsp. enterica serovar Derby]EHL9563462.1 type IV secretion system protein VirB10 [Salmonella enterica subsp. enterica serovar Altona]EKO0236246.1 type IV secretion system protein VirB10 [Salmonella enterica subsp.
MFGRKKGDVIDAGAELERAEQERIEGEYGASELASERRPHTPGARTLLMVLLCVIAVVLVTLSYKAYKVRGVVEDDDAQPQQVVRQVIPGYTPRPIRPEPENVPEPPQPTTSVPAIQPAPVTQPVRPQPTGPREKTPYELARERMLRSGLTAGSGGGDDLPRPQGGDVPAGGLMGGGGGGGELAEKLQPMRLSGSSAGRLGNRDMLITQGTQLDCVLETRLVTTQPGMTTCHLTRDVYSTSGRVVLLDRGSKVVGFYQGGLRQGQARIFVQWSRIETPSGVVINLDSPGTGPLGEAGLGGWIDRHFWERFGGAIMISLIGDLGDWASRQGSRQGDNSIQFSNTANGVESAAAEALRNSINIPPTLYKNQGERVNILVARDLDFSDVYSLESIPTK